MATKKEVTERRKEVVFMQNDGRKLCRQLVSLVDPFKGNNYESTNIRVEVYEDKIIVETFYGGDPGDIWYNQNDTEVSKSNIPFFTLKKLGML